MNKLEPRIKIVGGIANLANDVNKSFTRKELAAILNMFGEKTAQGDEYENPTRLIKLAIDHYANLEDLTTADNIVTTYKNT